MKKIGEFAVNKGTPFALNLSAVFVVQFFADQVKETLKNCDLVFCNEDEADAVVEKFECGNREGAAKFLASFEKVAGADGNMKPRVVVITQGAQPTIVATSKHGSDAAEDQTPTIELVSVLSLIHI